MLVREETSVSSVDSNIPAARETYADKSENRNLVIRMVRWSLLRERPAAVFATITSEIWGLRSTDEAMRALSVCVSITQRRPQHL